MRKLRISAISFLNTAPLMWDFQHGQPPEIGSPSNNLPADLAEDFEVSYTVPSSCAAELARGTSDIGIIPAITYTTIPNLVIVPDVAIASRREVRSILLISKIPLEQIHSVAVDTSSRTSVALLQILFEKWWGGGRKFTPMKPDLASMLEQCDAGLLIGDPALAQDRSRYLTFDLAEEWNRLTGKPFVFAFWAVRLDALRQMRPTLPLAKVFQQSRDHGLEPQNLEAIARGWAPRTGLNEEDIVSYLTRNIDYSLTTENIEGMEEYFRYAAEYGLIPREPELRFLGPVATSSLR